MTIFQRIRRILSPLYLFNQLESLTFSQQKWKHYSGTAMEIDRIRDPYIAHTSKIAWKIVDSKAFGIENESVSHSALVVLKILQKNGYAAFLVGGCVRDLILKRTPKDFDVITTASLKQVKMHFHRCIIVGQRFPICQVYISGNVIEVSSFSTIARNEAKKEKIVLPQVSDNNLIFECWKNSMKRDFTINCLFFEPFRCKIYDFVGGLNDLKASTVRTVIQPHIAFKEDYAKILRGLRIAARLGFQFSKETEIAIHDLSSSILTLNKDRLLLEMNFMMAYGAAASSINLLKQFNLLELLLPAHAANLTSQSDNLSAQRPILLMKLFMNADKLLRPNRPCSCILWLGLLAFHLALVDHPQDFLVIWTFSSILLHGTCNEAIKFVKGSPNNLVQFIPEILPPSKTKSNKLILKEASQFSSRVKSSMAALTNSNVLQQSLDEYSPPSPSQCMVFVSPNMGKKASKIFDVDICIKSHGKEEESLKIKEKKPSQNRKEGEDMHSKKERERLINYKLLKNGDLNESRFVLGKIIMNTLKDKPISESNREMDEGKPSIAKLSSLFR